MNAITSKWSRGFWVDLAERSGSTLVYGLITVLTTTSITEVNAQAAWTIVALPTVLTALKGLLANMKDAGSGASLVPPPAGPAV